MNYFDRIFAAARTTDNALYAITVIEGGESRTLQLRPANAANNCYSIAKAFTVTALGMLYDSGLLDPGEFIADIFSDELPPNADPKWRRVTVDNVMLHRFGTEHGFLDIDGEDPARFGSDDYLDLVLRHPLRYEPGEKRVYSDAAYYLLSRVVTQKSGENLDDFLRSRLFIPLGFAEAAWSRCPRGYAMGATGLYLRTPDIAKLGVLYRDGGIFGGKRIISQKWCDIVFEHSYELSRTGKNGFAKGGMFGQLLWLSPGLNLAVAWQSYDDSDRNRALTEFLYNI